jgi:protein-tyrosine-phosphatase
MAEALARKYGSDCMEPVSAGLAPAINLPAPTRSILLEKNIELGQHAPRSLYDLDLRQFDLLVNISGQALPGSIPVPVETWAVEDPYGGTDADYRHAREAIEMLVMRLILRIRSGKFDSATEGSSQ